MTNQFHEPGGSGGSDDAVWEDLVRRLEHEPTTQPAHELEADSAQAPAEPTPKAAPGVDPTLFTMHPALGGPRDYEASEELLEDFVPADPPAIGSGNPLVNLAWVAAAGAPLVLLLLAIFWRRAPMPLWIGLCVLALGGGAYLFARMPRHRHDNDDGAQV
ncbi:hypothetical protein CQ018_16575 [Arthrobacter sp. MYb227]|uniref:hypothetical protein n=1 Tax=Arthrobacter sp. MYb227 TaxID=1848601 RepID=UPI000CFC3844|nr:hypothetical protein [Arthrobacter sp. MYb227]PQZ88607.1 hypothetical protein CQ018_16575 [Arthrobacter sp. MYb227]